MSMSWFRLYAEFASDPKVQMMPEHMQRRLVMLFCMRCAYVTNETFHERFRNGDETSYETNSTFHETKCLFHDEEISFQMRISDAETQETKRLFLSKGFIDDGWNLTNWDRRQYASDLSTKRVREHRDRKRKLEKNEVKSETNETFHERFVTVSETPPEQNRTEQINTIPSNFSGTKSSSPKNEIDPVLIEKSRAFLDTQKKNHPTLVKVTDQKVRSGAITLGKLVGLDGYDLDKEILPALRWAVSDDFWSTNVLSLAGIRKQSKNGETKFQNILAAYHRRAQKKPSNPDPDWY